MARRPMPDIIVVIPGIMGSVLRQHDREVWNLSIAAGMHAVSSLGASITDLALTSESSDPGAAVDGVVADSVLHDLHQLPYLWKIDGYTGLINALAANFRLEAGENYFEFPYDWRRDNRIAAHRLRKASKRWLRAWRETSGNTGARLLIVAHSMGGLVARYFIEALEGWRDTKALVTFGTPYRGSVKALRTIVEGIRKGPFGIVNLSSLVRSFTSLYQLLPLYPCLGTPDGRIARLSEGGVLPNMSEIKLRDAAAFHAEIQRAVESHLNEEVYRDRRYRIIPVVGTHQETLQAARLDADGSIEFLCQHAGRDLKGDGTVPRISATPVELSNLGFESHVATAHASIQNGKEVLHHVCEAIVGLDLDLAAPAYRFLQAAPYKVTLDLEDAYWHDEPVPVRVLTEPSPSPALQAVVTETQSGAETARINFPAGREGWMSIELPPLPPGTYRCRVEGFIAVNPVTDIFTVFDRRYS